MLDLFISLSDKINYLILKNDHVIKVDSIPIDNALDQLFSKVSGIKFDNMYVLKASYVNKQPANDAYIQYKTKYKDTLYYNINIYDVEQIRTLAKELAIPNVKIVDKNGYYEKFNSNIIVVDRLLSLFSVTTILDINGRYQCVDVKYVGKKDLSDYVSESCNKYGINDCIDITKTHLPNLSKKVKNIEDVKNINSAVLTLLSEFIYTKYTDERAFNFDNSQIQNNEIESNKENIEKNNACGQTRDVRQVRERREIKSKKEIRRNRNKNTKQRDRVNSAENTVISKDNDNKNTDVNKIKVSRTQKRTPLLNLAIIIILLFLGCVYSANVYLNKDIAVLHNEKASKEMELLSLKSKHEQLISYSSNLNRENFSDFLNKVYKIKFDGYLGDITFLGDGSKTVTVYLKHNDKKEVRAKFKKIKGLKQIKSSKVTLTSTTLYKFTMLY